MNPRNLLEAERLYHSYLSKSKYCFRISNRSIEESVRLMKVKPRTGWDWWQAQLRREDSIKALQEGNQWRRRASLLLKEFPGIDTTP